jgi:hypothetical protein
MLISAAMTEGIGYEKGREEMGMKIESIDIKKGIPTSRGKEGSIR